MTLRNNFPDAPETHRIMAGGCEIRLPGQPPIDDPVLFRSKADQALIEQFEATIQQLSEQITRMQFREDDLRQQLEFTRGELANAQTLARAFALNLI